LTLDTNSTEEFFGRTQLEQGARFSNPVSYAVNALPERIENEQNDTIKQAQLITLPQIINGRIEKPQDTDVFRFSGRNGQRIVVEVDARKLHSPLDSLVRITDESGKVLALNDDNSDKNIGLLTHNADSYLLTTLSKDGIYFVHISDSGNHGGDSFAYRLRISEPKPDFMLFISPSSINVSPAETVPLYVQALRKDGFDGEIDIILEDVSGFSLSGGKILSGQDKIRLTLTTALPRPLPQPVLLKIKGRANINGTIVTRNAIPAEDMMQAFFYRHLVPSEQLLAAVINSRPRRQFFERIGPDIVEIPSGKNAFVWMRLPSNPAMRGIQLELSEPPAGISLQDVNSTPGELTFKISADANTLKQGFSDNLIIQAFNETVTKTRADPNKLQTVRNFVGVLPAIPFQIIQQ